MYKLLATDMDGTLLSSRRLVSRADSRALRLAAASGVHVTICTGRPFASAMVYGQSMGLRPYVLSANGAIGHDPSGARLFIDPMPDEVALAVIEILRRHQMLFHLYGAEEVVSENVPAWPSSAKHLTQWRDLLNLPSLLARSRSRRAIGPRHVKDTEAYVRERGNVLKFFCVEREPGAKAAVLADVQRAGIPLALTSSGSDNVEFNAHGVNKGTGLARLAGHLGVLQSQVIAVGDHYNDLEMLRWAGAGVAVANAIPEAKEAAAMLTVSNDESPMDAVVRSLISTNR